eukprot:TRINITY_DN7372_c0_g1_i1.p1 TRINITY_DN7372_c0_g1~~TRINITY_DN7372_c0_g1_i1.p1  ORF type:complete len:200 (-),score=50.55 TRINITY_DN7372_c0_g1_i1:208-807(-)
MAAIDSTDTPPSSKSAEPMNSAEEQKGIPLAPFVEDVEAFLAGRHPDGVLRNLDERLQQYKLLEIRLIAQKKDLQSKLPDIRKCLDIVDALKAKADVGEDSHVDFALAEHVYAQAVVKAASSVCLWLGANVMLEYSFDEAKALLEKNLENATTSLKALVDDIQLLRDQTNTTEVTMARIYNWDVQQRRKEKQQQAENPT